MWDVIARGKTARMPLTVEWMVNYWTLQGVRKIRIVNWTTGQVQMTWESSEGQLDFRLDEVNEQYNRELGQFLKIDTMPLVTPRKTMELDGVRKAAAANVVLDHLLGPLNNDAIKGDFAEGLLTYGTMGIGAWVNFDVALDMDTMLETIPPWELLPVPARPTRTPEAHGLIRHRWVLYDEIRQRFAKELKWPKKDDPYADEVDPQLDIRWAPLGARISDEHDTTGGDSGTGIVNSTPMRAEDGLGSQFKSGDQKKGDDQPWIHLTEYWCPDHKHGVKQSVIMQGRHIGRNVTFSDSRQRPKIPVGVARCSHSGAFFGRPWVSQIIPLNREVERMYGNLFKNVQELDQFGLLLLPANSGIKKQHLTSTSRPRVAYYEPDYTGNKFTMEKVQPVNTGDFPGRVAQTGIAMMDRLGRNTPTNRGEADGRVDSAAAYGILYETSNMSRVPCIESMNQAYSTVYKCILASARALLTGQDMISLETVDDSLAGISIDVKTGMMSLQDNPLPGPDEVKISIREKQPRLVSQRKQEVLLMQERQLLTPQSFAWINATENLGFPLDSRRIVEQRKLCMFRNIVQFNDGQTPREGIIISAFDDHEIQIQGIRDFMSTVVFSLASPEVQQYIEARLQKHEEYLGRGYPEPMPHPENMMAPGPGGQAPIPGNLPPQLQKVAAGLVKKSMQPQGVANG